MTRTKETFAINARAHDEPPDDQHHTYDEWADNIEKAYGQRPGPKTIDDVAADYWAGKGKAAARADAPVGHTRRRSPNASHPDAREPDDCDDLRVKSLDHAAIWAKYNSKAGGIQKVVPAKDDNEPAA